MPIIVKENYRSVNVQQQMLLAVEDPRPGHNVIYLGDNAAAHDSVTLKPIFGAQGTFKNPSSPYMGGAVDLQNTQTNGEYTSKTWLHLAGKFPAGQGKTEWYSYSGHNSTGTFYQNVPATSAWNMDPDQQKGQCAYKDNGDGTSEVHINSVAGNASWTRWESWTTNSTYRSIPDDKEIYEVKPDNSGNRSTNTSPFYDGAACGFTDLDGNNSGRLFVAPYGNLARYPDKNYMFLARYTGGTASENSMKKNSNGYFAQFVGMSRQDGNPIFWERHFSPYYASIFEIAKYNGAAWTSLLAPSNGNRAWAYNSTSYSYSNNRPPNGTRTSDAYMNFASSWWRWADDTVDYKYMCFQAVFDSTTRGVFLDCIQWNQSDDTFKGAGISGESSTTATLYHGDAGGNTSHYRNHMSNYFRDPVAADHSLGTEPTQSGPTQGAMAACFVDVHGHTNNNGSTETPWDPHAVGSNDCFATYFPSYGPIDDAGSKGRTIVSWSISRNGNGASYYAYLRCMVVVPENPFDWVWLDSGKTIIGAICKNNTYIYQFRRGSSITSPTTSGGDYNPDNAGTTTFNDTLASNEVGWVLTGIIPHQVLQMGIDKHDRIWYVTWDSDPMYYTGVQNRYAKQAWMVTDQTPFNVSLTGNATTDTITYSGSNIDKTLTVESLNYKGQRLSSQITLNITGNDAQFDNGSATKTITTSSSGTVDETITITGSGTFNVTATFGA